MHHHPAEVPLARRHSGSVVALGFLLLAGTLSLATPPLAASGAHGGKLPAETLPPPPLMDGIGTSKLAITTGSELAQKYFDQGVNLLHDYWDFEAYRAFREASRLDPNAAMPYWGLYMALAYNQAEHREERREAIAKAAALVGAASDREQRYIRAITRLNALGGEEGLEAYIDEMEKLIAAYPDELEAELFLIKFLVTDAANSFLDPDRGVGSGFDRARDRLRPLLESHDDSLAVHHYWIHAHEFGPEPEAALVSAHKVPTLAPESGHILHMPGHIFFRLGDYEKAYESFQAALRFDRQYMEENGIEPVDNWNYVHNLDYLVANCAEDGRYREGQKWARELYQMAVPHERAESVGLGFVVYGGRSAPARLHLRYGRWQAAVESLQETLEKTHFPSSYAADYLRGLMIYARGMAALERGDGARAGQSLQEVLGLAMGLTQQDAKLGSDWYFDVARRILVISSMELAGSLASGQGQHDVALQHLARAVQAEQGLGYGEPPHYTRPVFESVGLAQLRAGKAADAVAAYQRVLEQRPESGHAWYGIARAHDLAGDTAKARDAYRRFLEVWKNADTDLPEVVKAERWLSENP